MSISDMPLSETVMRPGLVWGWSFANGAGGAVEDCDAADEDCYRWLHLNLSDHRSQRWIDAQTRLPPRIRALMTAKDDGQRALIQKGVIGLLLHDFEREFDHDQTSRIGALHVAIGPRLIVTGRSHPLRCADMLHQRLVDGAPLPDAAAALALLLATLTDGLDEMIAQIAAELLADEDEFLAHGALPDTRDLHAVRRRAAQIHRLIAGMRGALHRLIDDPALPAGLAAIVQRHHQRLHLLDGEVVNVQGQLRLLRDELDLQAAQRTNQNIYFLSVMTALMLPATLVTGFFGMNTGDLPLAAGKGTLIAALFAVASSLATYLLLRVMGFVRR
jgi:zinc transporter